MATATITFDASDYGGMDFDPRRAKVYATNNAEDQTIYAAGNKQYIGSGTGTIGADGTGSIVIPVPGAGDNPASWQTTIHFDVPDRNAAGGRRKVSAGPFTITASGTLNSLVERMPIPPAYAAPALNRIDGVEEHGAVSGAVELDSDISTHWLDATGPTVLTLTDGPAGVATRYVSVLVASGAEDVTVADLEDVTLTDGAFATFAWVRGVWILAGAGASGEAPVSDTTPPSAVTDLAADPGDDGTTATVTWTPATDAESTVKYRYRLYENGETAPAWPTSGSQYNLTVTTVNLTGLTVGTDYVMEVQAYSAGGSAAADSALFSTPTPAGWNLYDTLTTAQIGANGDRGTTADFTTTGGRTYRVASDYGNQISVVSGKIKTPTDNGDCYGRLVSGSPTSPPIALEADYDITLVGGQYPEIGFRFTMTTGSIAGTVVSDYTAGGAYIARIGPDNASGIVYTPGPGKTMSTPGQISGVPATGRLRVAAQGQLLRLYINGDLWITADCTSAVDGGSAPNPLVGLLNTLSTKIKNGAAIGNIDWETYA